MPQSEAPDKTRKITDVISTFLTRHRLTLIVALAAVVIIVAGLFIYIEVRSSREQAARLAAEEVQELYDDWIEASEEERPALAERLSERVDAVVEVYPRFYAAQRALMVRGDLYWELEDWNRAADDFSRAANGFGDSYLTSIALSNAAAAAEEAGDVSRAKQLLQQLVDQHATAEVPRALFTLGRLAESTSDRDEALEYYNQLVQNHAGSNWTNLARNRIIALSVR